MQEKIIHQLRAWRIDSRDSVLLAISGGLDSRCLLEILLEAGFQPALAHCNFNLRGEEAKADAKFVEQLAQEKDLKLHLREFQAQDFADQQGLSTQMAARNLRYDFFAQLQKQHGYQAVLTAHHADDQIETMLFKLARGAGLEGITGIPERRGIYYRPMLMIFREELEHYAKGRDLNWREDRSNKEDKYLRNAYRNHLIPAWSETQEDFKEKILHSGSLLKEQAQSLTALLNEKLSQYLHSEGEEEHLFYQELHDKDYWQQLLFQWLQSKGPWDWSAVNNLSKRKKGRYTFNENWLLLQDRGFLRLSPHLEAPAVKIEIQADDQRIQGPGFELEIKKIALKDWHLIADPDHHYFDLAEIEFPLYLRNWEEGDRFQPLGMTGQKKVSDYLIDRKVSLAAKAKKLVLECDKGIIALLGERIDHRYRVHNSTKTIYFVRLRHSNSSS